MGVTTTNNKPINPRGNDQSPLAYNRAKLYSGKALDFDGVNDKIDVSFAFSGNTTSISFYLNWDAYGTSNVQFVCESQNGSTFMVHLGGGAGTNGIRFSMSGTTFDSPNAILSGYNHYTLTTNNTTASLYVNGTLFNSESVSLGSAVTTSLAIAYRSDGNILFLNGKIAGFKIFNTALTAAQIADLYNNPEKIVPTGVDNTALKLWLPMMEGAGTTAYDGSGNGNHGTISGATYVNGIGAPVAQSAVMDWNKGSNIYSYSNEFDEWTKANATITADYAISPDGTQNATRVEMTPGGIMYISATGSSGDNTLSVWAKSTTGTGAQFRFFGNGNTISSGLQTTTDEWQRFEYTFTYSAVTAGIKGDDDILFFGFQHEISSEAGAYIPTIGNTTQPTPVLLPQGLTTGRDITGVNLFENVRKQGALNLDGNSWAEVHDNESLDFSSGMTMECWVQLDYLDSFQHILGKWSFPSKREFMIYYNASTQKVDFNFGHDAAAEAASVSVTANGQWFHLVGTTDGTTITPYVNGVAGTTAAVVTGLGANTLPVTIGTDYNKAVNQFTDKQLAQPRIYNRALTAEEVLKNYNAGKNTYTN